MRTVHPLVSDDGSGKPRADLGGLSVAQAREVLDDPVDGTGPLRIAADLPAGRFEPVPTLGLDNARRMLWLLDAEGSWRLNASGLLPAAVARTLLHTLEWWPGYVETVDVSREWLTGDDLAGVHGTRIGLQHAGLIRVEGDALSVTPEGVRMIDRRCTGELAAHLLTAMLRDEGYEAVDPNSVIDINRGVRRRRKLLLWKLSRIRDGWWPNAKLVAKLTTREVRTETRDYGATADRYIEGIMSSLFLDPLADLGLLESDLDSYSSQSTRYRRTPLFGEMISWDQTRLTNQ